MGEIMSEPVDPIKTIPVGKLELEEAIIVGEEDPELAAASKRETGEFERKRVLEEIARREARRMAAQTRTEVEKEVLNYLNGDECPTPVCVPRFNGPKPDEFDDIPDTPVEIPRGKEVLKPGND